MREVRLRSRGHGTGGAPALALPSPPTTTMAFLLLSPQPCGETCPPPRCATSRWRGLAHAQALPCVLQVNVCSRPPVCTRLASSEVTWSTQMSRMRECELSRPEGEMSADAAAPTGEYQGKTGGLRFHVVAPVLPSSSHSARCTLAFSQHTPHHQRAQGTYK
jgi:hypothetical protein